MPTMDLLIYSANKHVWTTWQVTAYIHDIYKHTTARWMNISIFRSNKSLTYVILGETCKFSSSSTQMHYGYFVHVWSWKDSSYWSRKHWWHNNQVDSRIIQTGSKKKAGNLFGTYRKEVVSSCAPLASFILDIFTANTLGITWVTAYKVKNFVLPDLDPYISHRLIKCIHQPQLIMYVLTAFSMNIPGNQCTYN